MCGNRVEELESRVKELEASVEGLTDELLECKVRLREIEDAVDEDLPFVPEMAADETAAVETSESTDQPTAAEATKSEAPETEDKTEESDSDIIVA